MKMSPTIGKLALALSKAQGEMKAAAKDASNPFFKSHYATLGSVIDSIRAPFLAHELSFAQPMRVDELGNVFVITIIMHSSGEWLSGEISAKPVKADPQGVGSLISYLKRYGLQAIVGLASEDDDGNTASGRTELYTGTTDQLKRLTEIMAKAGVPSSKIDAIHKAMMNQPCTESIALTIARAVK